MDNGTPPHPNDREEVRAHLQREIDALSKEERRELLASIDAALHRLSSSPPAPTQGHISRHHADPRAVATPHDELEARKSPAIDGWFVESASRASRVYMGEDVITLTKARSMLLILLATCRETLTALDAAGNALDSAMTEDLRRMIARSEGELEVLTEKLHAARSS